MNSLHLSAALVVTLALNTGVVAQQSAGTPVSIDPRPRVSIGVVEGDTLYELHRIVTPFIMADGRIVVPLGGSNTIRVSHLPVHS
jgi:hypothetical protein